MRLSEVARAEAQSFDRVAADYERLVELNDNGQISRWLESLLPTAGGRALDLGCGTGRHAALLAERFEHVDAIDVSAPMITLAQARRPRQNIHYRQADLQDVDGPGRYDLITSALTLHHVPDLHLALGHIKSLLALGGRAILVDVYHAPPVSRTRRALQRVVPLRPRLRALAMLRLGKNLVRRGPATAWEIYRLSTRRAWLDHRVSDRFFSPQELERCCGELFPGYRIAQAPHGIALLWDAPPGSQRPPDAGLAGASRR
jgi:ubiquinone/menaquinone biosynthesis C-methylase UbiE